MIEFCEVQYKTTSLSIPPHNIIFSTGKANYCRIHVVQNKYLINGALRRLCLGEVGVVSIKGLAEAKCAKIDTYMFINTDHCPIQALKQTNIDTLMQDQQSPIKLRSYCYKHESEKVKFSYMCSGGMYPMWRYVPNVEVCTPCGGMYPMWRYVPTVEVCTQCGGMYPMWRYVPNMEVCTQCGGMYPLWRYVPTVEVCTQCGACRSTVVTLARFPHNRQNIVRG